MMNVFKLLNLKPGYRCFLVSVAKIGIFQYLFHTILFIMLLIWLINMFEARIPASLKHYYS